MNFTLNNSKISQFNVFRSKIAFIFILDERYPSPYQDEFLNNNDTNRENDISEITSSHYISKQII
jgi:hypothetical protein